MIRLLTFCVGCCLTTLTHASPASFDFMLGNWTSDSAWTQADRSVTRTPARHHFYRAFGGQGIVDDNQQWTEGNYDYIGSAIRTWDEAQGHWECRWYDGNARQWGPAFFLQPQDGLMSGVIAGSDEHGRYVDRITFEPRDRNHVSWRMVRQYETLDKPMTIGSIEYKRVN